MAFDTTGTYIQVTGATTAVPGAVVQSSIWNSIHTDLGGALTQYMQEFIAQPANRNILWMNGSFEVWQRGSGDTSVISVAASTALYTVDRYILGAQAGQDSTVAAVTGLITQSKLGARVRRTAGQTGTGQMYFTYPLDTDEVFRMKGKFITITFLVQAGANWSPTSGTLFINLYTGTAAGGPAQRGLTPYTGEVNPLSAAVNLTPGGAIVTVSINSSAIVPTNATQAEFSIIWNPTGTAGAADDFTIDDVQIEVQNASLTWIPTVYDRMTTPQMLQACKRFFNKTMDYNTLPAGGAGRNGALQVISGAAGRVGIFWRFPVEMFRTPVITTFNPDGGTANWQNITTVASNVASPDAAAIGTKSIFIAAATVAAADQLLILHAQAAAGIA